MFISKIIEWQVGDPIILNMLRMMLDAIVICAPVFIASFIINKKRAATSK